MLIAMALPITHCRENAAAVSYPESMAWNIGTEERLIASGDSLAQAFTLQRRDQHSWRDVARIELQRLDVSHHRQAWEWSEDGWLCERSFREGDAGYTVTTGLLPRKRLLFHRIRCDHPGLLHGKATMHPYAEILPREIRQTGTPALQLWLLPFESEVRPQDKALEIRGEGEMLLLWHWSDQGATTWQELLRPYDPDHDGHPDIAAAADALIEEAARLAP